MSTAAAFPAEAHCVVPTSLPASCATFMVLLTAPNPTGLHVFGFPCFLCLNIPYQSQHLLQDAAFWNFRGRGSHTECG